MRKFSLVAAFGAFLLFGQTAAAVAPEQKCEAGKNQAAGKYAACRQGAAKTLALTGDTARYGESILKCETKFTDAWAKEESKASAAGGTCLDAPLVVGDFKLAIDAHSGVIATALGGGGLIDCPADLTTCTSDLGTCNTNLGTCNTSYSACSGSLSTCTANYAGCSSSLATCSAGTAAPANVLAGKTFSSSTGIGSTGIMPNNGSVSITPGTADQTIPLGYHDGTGNVAGDAALIASNIKLGASIFGVAGTLGCGNGAIDAGEQCDQSNLNGDSCASLGYVAGNLVCGADCALDTSGCYSVRFTDNGNGTVTDSQTGLMWEKKGHLNGAPVVCSSAGACPDPHDADNTYTYSAGSPTGPPGTAFTVMLVQLTAGGGFAGHTDWRLPTREELQSIIDYAGTSSPTVSAVFDNTCSPSCNAVACSCTMTARHWTNDLVTSISGSAWVVDPTEGSVLTDSRDTDYSARAVRNLP